MSGCFADLLNCCLIQTPTSRNINLSTYHLHLPMSNSHQVTGQQSVDFICIHEGSLEINEPNSHGFGLREESRVPRENVQNARARTRDLVEISQTPPCILEYQ